MNEQQKRIQRRLGKVVREARGDLVPRRAARQIGIDDSQLARIETGERGCELLTLAKLVRWVEARGVSIDLKWILFGRKS